MLTSIDRRAFVKYCVGSAAALGLSDSFVGRLLAVPLESLPTVIWLSGASCTGCTVSLANLKGDSGPRDIGDLLLNTIGLSYHPNLMGAAGALAVETLDAVSSAGGYVLAVEGGIPTAYGGHTCTVWTEVDPGGSLRDVTFMEAVDRLASGPGVAAVLAVGTCAAFGGIPGGQPNPTGVVSVGEHTGSPVINIPGCPAHPDWVVWTIAQLLSGSVPDLDGHGRPSALFGSRVHDLCPYRDRPEAHTFGLHNRCLEELGCKGPDTRADCAVRRWNDGTSWCAEAGSICIGCTEPTFPDGFSPFYEEESD